MTDSLEAHGVIASRLSFKLLARVRGVDRAVQAGVYEFPPGTLALGGADILRRAEGRRSRFTVPEGLTIPEVAALAAEQLGISR